MRGNYAQMEMAWKMVKLKLRRANDVGFSCVYIWFDGAVHRWITGVYTNMAIAS